MKTLNKGNRKEENVVIEVEDLTMAYDDKPVIWDVDIKFYQGSITAIIGPNGAGKSTLLKGILGLMKPLTGHTSFFGQEYQKVRERIAYVPQSETVNWNFPIRVRDVVMMSDTSKLGLFQTAKKEMKNKALEALRQMEMVEFANKHIADLSGGQKQRVFIARALNQDADIYIMDEPLAGVDKKTEQIIMTKFKELKRLGKTILVVHHDMNTLKQYFDHVVVIDKTIKGQGRIEDVFGTRNPLEWMQNR